MFFFATAEAGLTAEEAARQKAKAAAGAAGPTAGACPGSCCCCAVLHAAVMWSFAAQGSRFPPVPNRHACMCMPSVFTFD
jgi:hypothetical protein